MIYKNHGLIFGTFSLPMPWRKAPTSWNWPRGSAIRRAHLVDDLQAKKALSIPSLYPEILDENIRSDEKGVDDNSPTSW